MKRIRGGSGLGDAIYVRAIADHLISIGESVEACSNYPDVFLGSGATVSPFRRERINMLCHYSARKSRTDTTQWQDVCGTAGLEELPLTIKWKLQNQNLINEMRAMAGGRKIVLVHGGREPMGRTDGFGSELLPSRRAFESVLVSLKDCFLVHIGKGTQIYALPVEVDLNGKTSIADLFDLTCACDGVIAQCSFAVPMAEIFDKPLLTVWSKLGLASRMPYIRQITPQKILSKASSKFVVDDYTMHQLQSETYAFFDSL